MITVEALAEEILRVDPTGMTEALEFSRKLLPFIERHIAAGLQGAGCGACGDGCKDRGSCRLADESPKPASALPLPTIRAYAEICGTDDPDVFEENLWAWMKGMPVPEGENITLFCALDDAIRYGDAREAAARGAVPANWHEDSSLETWFPYTAERLKALEAENEKLRAAGRTDAVLAYCEEMGEAGNRYHASFKTAHPLPQQWLWEECWNAMISAISQQPTAEGAEPVAVAFMYFDNDGRKHLTATRTRPDSSPLFPKPTAYKAAAVNQKMTTQGEAVATALTGKYGEVLRPFLAMMEHELHANAGKGDRPGWLAMSRQTALLEIYYHVAKLQKAAKDDDTARIGEHAADVANMAMMLTDKCDALITPAGPQS